MIFERLHERDRSSRAVESKNVTERFVSLPHLLSYLKSPFKKFKRFKMKPNSFKCGKLKSLKQIGQFKFRRKIKNRFNEYNTKTSILINFYNKQGKFYSVDGKGSVNDITLRLFSLVDSLI